MKGVREPRDAQLHFVVAKLGTHELDSLVVMAVSRLWGGSSLSYASLGAGRSQQGVDLLSTGNFLMCDLERRLRWSATDWSLVCLLSQSGFLLSLE